ncbi:hypothetical protein Droror1_Dr00011481 [Drosera rotundifolia]
MLLSRFLLGGYRYKPGISSFVVEASDYLNALWHRRKAEIDNALFITDGSMRYGISQENYHLILGIYVYQLVKTFICRMIHLMSTEVWLSYRTGCLVVSLIWCFSELLFQRSVNLARVLL